MFLERRKVMITSSFLVGVLVFLFGFFCVFVSGRATKDFKITMELSKSSHLWMKVAVLCVVGGIATIYGSYLILEISTANGRLITELPPAGTLFEIKNLGNVGENVKESSKANREKKIVAMRRLRIENKSVPYYASATQYYDASTLNISGFVRGNIVEVEEHFGSRTLVALKPEFLKFLKFWCLGNTSDPWRERDDE